MSPTPWALPILEHKAKFIMNQTYVDHEGMNGESSYAYPSIVGRVLTPISRHSFPPILEE